MAKQFYSCNWVPSRITETQINGYVTTGALASKRVLHWRVPESECPPEPQEGEVIVFMQHLDRGFSPPGSKNFRDVLASFQLHPQDIGPNSVSNICNFQVFLRSLSSRRANRGAVPGLLSSEPPHRILRWSQHRAWWRFNSEKERGWLPSCKTS